MVFLENYDMVVARHLVQGADLWLTNPRRPLEASGTSGMKSAMNGGLNLSVQDGWWVEAYEPSVGWSIGSGEQYQDQDYQDEVEANAIYNLLEKEIVPLFYDRGEDGLPRGWVAMMKTSIRKIAPVYNTHRMVKQYTERMYLPAVAHAQHLTGDGMAPARELAHWKAEMRNRWPELRIVRVETDVPSELPVGSLVEVRADVHLGSIKPEDVAVELYEGSVDANQQIVDGTPIPMLCVDQGDDGTYSFSGSIPCSTSGLKGYSLRVLPKHEDLGNPYEPGLILWA